MCRSVMAASAWFRCGVSIDGNLVSRWSSHTYIYILSRLQFGAPRSGLGQALVSGVIPYSREGYYGTGEGKEMDDPVGVAVGVIVLDSPLDRLAESLDEVRACEVGVA